MVKYRAETRTGENVDFEVKLVDVLTLQHGAIALMNR